MIGDASAILGSRAGEMEAIRSFIMSAHALTPEAARIRDEFIIRWEDLGFMDRELPTQAVYDEMKNRENQFWIANRPPEERATAVKIVQENRSDPRQTTGGVFPADPRVKGIEQPDIEVLDEQIEENKPLIEFPAWFKPAVIITGLAGVGLGIAKIVTGLSPVSLLTKIAKRS